jgi:metal-responsive CopG/Arc/MetJ family transcriptional regulator
MSNEIYLLSNDRQHGTPENINNLVFDTAYSREEARNLAKAYVEYGKIRITVIDNPLTHPEIMEIWISEDDTKELQLAYDYGRDK